MLRVEKSTVVIFPERSTIYAINSLQVQADSGDLFGKSQKTAAYRLYGSVVTYCSRQQQLCS